MFAIDLDRPCFHERRKGSTARVKAQRLIENLSCNVSRLIIKAVDSSPKQRKEIKER